MRVLTTNALIRPIETSPQGPQGGVSYDDPLVQSLGQFTSWLPQSFIDRSGSTSFTN